MPLAIASRATIPNPSYRDGTSHRLGGPVQARQGVVVGVRDPGGAGGPRGGEDALAVVAGRPASTSCQSGSRAAASISTSSPLRGSSEPTCSTNGATRPCVARAQRRSASGSPGAKRSSTPLPITSTRSTPQRSRTSAAVASDTQMTRVAERTERGIEVRN